MSGKDVQPTRHRTQHQERGLVPTPPFSLPHSGGQWMVSDLPPSSGGQREAVSEASPSSLCHGCVSVGTELQTASENGDVMGLTLARARTARHFANWHGKGNDT